MLELGEEKGGREGEKKKEKKKQQHTDGEINKGMWEMVWMARISSLVIKRLFYTQKPVLIARTLRRLSERAEEYLLGEFTRYLFFALGLGWALGTINACLM